MGHLAAIRRLFLCFGALRSCQDNQSELQQECVVTGYPRQIRHKIISVSQPRLKGDASQCLLFSFLTRSPDYRVMISIITVRQNHQSRHNYNTAPIRVIQKEPAGDRFGWKPERGDYAPLANNTYSLTAFTCWPPTEEFPPTARWARSIFSHYTRSELSSNPTNAHIFFTNPLIVRNSWRIPVCLDSERGDISCGNGNQLILKRFDT